MTPTTPEAKPLIKWAGSKKLVIPQIKAVLGNRFFTRYIEPFAGSAQLFFNLNISDNVISDMNADLINAYNLIKSQPGVLTRLIHSFGHVDREKYYQLRNIYNETKNKKLKSALFIVLNRYCFNGLYRTNSQGKFNVPYGYEMHRSLPSLEQVNICSVKFKSARLICGDFEQITREYVCRDALVYIDPPYSVSNRVIFQQYTPTNFGSYDLERLCRLLEYIDNVGGYFVVSYAYSKDVAEYFKAWLQKRIIVKRQIAGFTKSRKRACELIITNING